MKKLAAEKVKGQTMDLLCRLFGKSWQAYYQHSDTLVKERMREVSCNLLDCPASDEWQTSAPGKSLPWYNRPGLAIYNNNIVRALVLFAVVLLLLLGCESLSGMISIRPYESPYHHIRDVVFNATSFDLNYVVGLIALYSMFLMVMLIVYKRKELLSERLLRS